MMESVSLFHMLPTKQRQAADTITIFTALTELVLETEELQCDSSLQAYGCDEGWSNYSEYCYLVVAGGIQADAAKNYCVSHDASLASVWSPGEKEFIVSLWRFPINEVGFLWIGLRGTVTGSWQFDDGSVFTYNIPGTDWSLFTGVSGIPLATSSKCLALRNSGTLAFLDCPLEASAYVCKKALPKVFVTSGMLNHTSPVAASPLGHVQLFERMFPPLLTTLPGSGSYMAEITVATEVGCAFNCFSLNGCQVFQVSCNTVQNCSNFRCKLFSDFTT
ncbi:uncharacterized protein LOC131956478 [Physella acuta]|uniref:uncharacterized protein LOC131956478 n=1 Tax=Physella acuta TaxID=109671 RepID=UPI0027DBF94E|nr:uncharacterized protein LOC131956478 [Physella acuta]